MSSLMIYFSAKKVSTIAHKSILLTIFVNKSNEKTNL